MKKNLRISYPWPQLKRGMGFFVPCLDTETVRIDGLRDALRYRIFHAKATVGVKGGRLGVWFHL